MSLTGASSLDLGKRLLEASREGNVSEVTDLMATGAPLTSDWLGTSPLHLAAQCGHTETAQILLSAGISRNGTTKVEKTPLHLAAQHGNLDIVKLLVVNGGLIDAVDMLNMTPLHWACEGGHEEIVDVLLKAGAKVTTRSKFGKTAEDIAIRKGYNNIILKLLSDYDVTSTPTQGVDTNVYEVKKRARGRKFPMTAGSWAAGDQGRSDRTPSSRHGGKKKRTGSSENDHDMEGCGSPENNLSSLVSAAAMVRSKSEDLSGHRGRTPETSQRDPSVLDTLATLATASTQVSVINRSVAPYGPPSTMVMSSPSAGSIPNFITIPGLQNQMAMTHPSAVNLMNHPQLTANLPANLVGNLQMASPFSLNIVPSVGGQPRLQLGSNPAVNNLQHITLPINMQQASTQPGTIIAGSNAQTIQPTPTAGTTLSIVGGMPSSTSPYGHPLATGQPGLQGHTVTMSPQPPPGVPQGSIPVNIPISLFNSMLSNAMAGSTENQQVVSSNATNTTAPIPIQPASSTVTPTAGTPTQEVPSVQYIPVAGPGGVQLIPNHAYLQSQLMTALRGAIAPGYGQVPVVQQPGIYSPGTFTFPLNPINLSNILPTALSISQLPIPASQSQVTTAAASANVSVNLSNKDLVSSVTPVAINQQRPLLKPSDVIPIQPRPGDNVSSANQQIIPKLQQLYQNYFSNSDDMPKVATATTTTAVSPRNDTEVSSSEASSVSVELLTNEKAPVDSPTNLLISSNKEETSSEGSGDQSRVVKSQDEEKIETVEKKSPETHERGSKEVAVVDEDAADEEKRTTDDSNCPKGEKKDGDVNADPSNDN